jgi:hypothetical protein
LEVVSLKLKDLEALNTYLNDKKYDAVIDNNSKDVAQATAITTAVKVGYFKVLLMTESNMLVLY